MSLSVFAPDGEIVLHWSELGGLWSLDCRWLMLLLELQHGKYGILCGSMSNFQGVANAKGAHCLLLTGAYRGK